MRLIDKEFKLVEFRRRLEAIRDAFDNVGGDELRVGDSDPIKERLKSVLRTIAKEAQKPLHEQKEA